MNENLLAKHFFDLLNNEKSIGKHAFFHVAYEFLYYLKELNRIQHKKKPTDRAMFDQILKSKSHLNENDQIDNQQIKFHLYASYKSYQRILLNIDEADDYYQKYYNYRPFLIDFICDLKDIIPFFDKNQDYDFLVLNTNHSISSYYFSTVSALFHKKQLKDNLDDDAFFGILTLLIRHSIERRIKGILGIDFIDNKGQYVGLTTLIKMLKKTKIKFTKDIDVNIISKINTWSNHYLHRGIRPYPWVLESVIYYLERIFYAGKYAKQSWSIYASTTVDDIDSFKTEIFDFLKKELKSDNIIVHWSPHEVAK